MAHLTQGYFDYLKSPQWQENRKKVLSRDKWTCQRCGGNGSDVHHITYERFGRERLSDLVTLCRDCHNIKHRQKNIFIAACQTCGEVLAILVETLKGGWTRYTCSDGHIREYRKKRGER